MAKKEKEVHFQQLDSGEPTEADAGDTALVVFNPAMSDESRLRKRSRVMSIASCQSDASDTQDFEVPSSGSFVSAGVPA